MAGQATANRPGWLRRHHRRTLRYFTQAVDDKLWHNAGVIGMPANDGTQRGWYSLLVPTADGIEICSASLDYDAQSAARKVRARGLPEGYAAALEKGLWPSCDVLPGAELQLRGRPISAGSLLWNGASAYWPPTPASPARRKFSDPDVTAGGERRASVQLDGLETVWFNTGTLCNLACAKPGRDGTTT